MSSDDAAAKDGAGGLPSLLSQVQTGAHHQRAEFSNRDHDPSTADRRKRRTRSSYGYSDCIGANAEDQTAADPHPFREYRQILAEAAADTEHDNYMSAEEALAYGLIDKIIDKR